MARLLGDDHSDLLLEGLLHFATAKNSSAFSRPSITANDQVIVPVGLVRAQNMTPLSCPNVSRHIVNPASLRTSHKVRGASPPRRAALSERRPAEGLDPDGDEAKDDEHRQPVAAGGER